MADTPIDTAGLRTIADTIEQNGGWHIAALHVRGAADELERLRAREAELLAQIKSMRTGLDDALDKVRRLL